MGLRSLVGFLTTIPARGDIGDAARSLHLAPLIGLLEGLLVAGASILLLSIYPSNVAAGLLLLVHLALTGGLHMDGFTDYIEAVAARARGRAAERILEDPRRGGFAIAYTGALLVARYGLLTLAVEDPWLLVASYLAAAEALYAYIYYARGPARGLGGLFKESTRGRRPICNIILYAALSAPLVAIDPRLAPPLLAPVAAVLVARDSNARLGRPSGDAAGFSYEASLTIALALGVAGWSG